MMSTTRRRWFEIHWVMIAWVLMAVCASVSWAGSQPSDEEQAVLAVVEKFFETMTSKDVAGARETLILDGQFMSIRDGGEASGPRATPLATYIEQLGAGSRLQEERMWNPEVKIHGRIAMVWTPYDFHNDGELSHCGIDVFTLLATEDGWRIAGVAFTVEPTGCETLGQPER